MAKGDNGFAEGANAASGAPFRMVFENCPDAILLADAEAGNIIDANQAACQLMEMSRDELVGLHHSELHPKEQAERYKAIFREHVQAERGISRDVHIQRPSGELVPVDIAASTLEISGRRVVEAVLRDVTDRRRAEEAYRTVVENSLQGLAIIQDSRIVFANQALADIVGYTVGELLSLRPAEVEAVVRAEDRELVWGRFRERLGDEPVPPRYEFRATAKDGTLAWLEVFASRIEYLGRPAVQAAIVDITERKRADEELRQSEERFRALSAASFEAIAIHDKGTIMEANEGFAAVFGHDVSEVIGMHVVDFMAPESRELVLDWVLSGSEEPYEAVGLRKGGSTIVCELRGRPVPYKGRLVRVTAIRDITERKRAEQQVAEYVQDLKILSDAAMSIVGLPAGVDIYRFIGEKVRELVGDSIVAVASFDGRQGPFVVRTVLGLGRRTGTVSKHLGGDPIGMRVNVGDEVLGALAARGLARIPDDLHELTRGRLSRRASRVLRKALGLGQMYAMGFVTNGEMFGAIVIMLRTGAELRNEGVIETFVNQASVALRRRSAEEALRREKERFQVLVEESPLAVSAISEDGDYEYVNPEFIELFGYTLDDISSGQDWFVKAYPDEAYREEVISTWVSDLKESADGTPTPKRFTVRCKDGSDKVIHFRAARLETGGQLVIYEDITDRMRAEEEIRENECRYRGLFEEAAISLWEEDWSQVKEYLDDLRASGTGDFRAHFREHPDAVDHCIKLVRVLDVNRATLEMRGVTDKNELLAGLWNLVSRASWEVFREQLAILAEGGRQFASEVTETIPSGERKHLLMRVNIPDGYEHSLAKVFVSALDITELKQAEGQLRGRNEQLAALNAIGKTVGGSLDPQEILNLGLSQVLDLMGLEVGTVRLLDVGKDELKLVAHRGLVSEYAREQQALKPGRQAIDGLIREAEQILVQDVSKERLVAPHVRRALKKEGLRSLAAVALRTKKEVVGVLVVFSREPDHFKPEEVELLGSIGRQIGVAVENASLYQEQKRRLSEMEALRQTTLDITRQLDKPRLLHSIVERAAALVGARAGGLYLYHEDREELELVVSYYLDKDYTGTRLNVGEGLSGKVVRTGQPEILEDYASFEERAEVYRGAPFRGVIGVPLKWGDRILGVLNVTDVEQPRTFTAHDLWVLELFASQAAIAIQNAWLHEETLWQLEELSAIEEIVHELSSTLDYQKVIELVLDKAIEATDATAGTIAVLDEAGTGLRLLAYDGFPEGAVEPHRDKPLSIKHGIVGRVVREGKSALVGDVSHDPDYLELTPETRSQLTVPVLREDKVVGVIALESPERGGFSKEQEGFVEHLAKHAAVAMENARLHQETVWRVEELSAIEEVVHELSSTLDSRTVIQLVLSKAMQATDATAGAIVLITDDDSQLSMLASEGYPPDHAVDYPKKWPGVEPGILGAVVRTGQLSLVGDVTQDRDYFEVLPETRSQLTVPILREGEVAGAIVLESRQFEGFSRQQAGLVQHLAKHAALALQNARLHEEALRRVDELSAIEEIVHELSSTLDLRKVMQLVLSKGIEATNASGATIDVLDEQRGELHMLAYQGYPEMAVTQFLERPLRVDRGIVGRVASTGQACVVADVSHDSDYLEVSPSTRSQLTVPILREGKVAGVLSLESPRLVGFTKEHAGFVQHLAKHAALAMENARLYERLRQSEERYRTYVENVPDAIWETDADGYFTYWSPQVEKLVGYTAEELLRHTAYEFLVHPDDAGQFSSAVRQMVKGKRQEDTLRHRATHKDRSVLQIETSVRPVREESGRIVKFQGVARDISERVRLQAQLVQSAKLSGLGQMIAGVAHELNNPLTTVMGYAQLLQVTNAEESVKDDLQRIYSDALRAQRVVQNLLTFARQKKPQRSPTDINDTIEHTLALRKYQLKVDAVKLVTELEDNLPWTMADSHQLQQVFLNIINNAHQAMVEGGRGGILTVKSELVDDDVIRVSFSDTGPGIPTEFLDRVFDPFFTTKDIGVGTGLGLSVSHGIVQEHGGRIWVTSEPGQGATFFVELPVKSWIGEVLAPVADEGPHELSSEGRRVLVIDDEQNIVDLIVRALVESGYRVEGTTSPRLGLERLRDEACDLIICDIRMPYMSGPEWEREVRAMGQTPAERIIFMTGDLLSPTTQAFLERWEGKHISKPFKVQELRAIVKEALGGGAEH